MNRALRRALRAYHGIYCYCVGDVSLTCDIAGDHRVIVVSYRVYGEHWFYSRYVTPPLDANPELELAVLLERVEDEVSLRAIRAVVLEGVAVRMLAQAQARRKGDPHASN